MKKADQASCRIVAVDGPAGSGKSSVCSRVCAETGWTYVNTGFLYRAVAYLGRERGLVPAGSYVGREQDELIALLDDFCEHLAWNPQSQKVHFKDFDLTPHLYSDQAGQDASTIGKNTLVREKLLPLQRKLALQATQGAVVDGRDIGSVVFPDAALKIFLTASIEERARRRLHQLKDGAAPSESELEAIKSSIRERDQQDAGRGAAPLIRAPDAVLIDSSSLDLQGTVATIVHLMRERGLV